MLKEKIVYSVYESDDYDSFSYIMSNRDINAKHVKSLVAQIEDGYELPPLIIKPDGKILDGQHRFEALKSLGRPVQYIIKESLKKDTLQKSNSVVRKWTVNDHINFHAKEGNTHYIKLKEFMAYSGLSARNASDLLGSVKKFKSPIQGIENGTFYVTSEDDAYNFYDNVVIKIREHMTNKMLSSVRIIYNAGADIKVLINVVNAMHDELELVSKTSKITERIISVYNKECERMDRIKVSYNKSGQIVLG